ncbi:MAG: hypothetical protein IPG73_13800 [Ignavibacteria bacterium]|nr:hypothetical protein [Ignavibacteria bacterium]
MTDKAQAFTGKTKEDPTRSIRVVSGKNESLHNAFVTRKKLIEPILESLTLRFFMC